MTPAGEPAVPTTTATTLGAAPTDDRSGEPTGDAPHADAGEPRRLGHRPELDGIRALALISVVFYHVGLLMWHGRPSWLFGGGQVGLDLFFALSGFLITVLLLGEHARTGRVAAGAFLRRRALRLVPALAGLMIGLVAVSLVGERYEPTHVLASAGWVLTFTTNLVVDRPIAEVGHAWSLSVEAHFYLAWGLVAALVTARARRPHVVLAAAATAGIVACAIGRLVVLDTGDTVRTFNMYVNTLHRIDGPLTGALAGVAWSAGWLDRLPARAARWLAGGALVALAVAAAETSPLSPALHQGLFTALGLCGALLIVGTLHGGDSRVRRLLARRPLVLIGTISYSVYLWHLPIIMWLERNIGGWPQSLQMTAAVGAALVVGALSYRYLERPYLRRKARRRPVTA